MSDNDASEKLSAMGNLSREHRSVLRTTFRDVVNKFALATWSDIIRNLTGTVLHVQTGRLRSSITTKVDEDSDGNFNVRWGSNVVYAAIHEFGGTTAPHDIFPRKGSVLHFVSGGKDVFARFVHHPGSRIPERPYFRPAIEENRVQLQDRLNAELIKIVEAYGHA